MDKNQISINNFIFHVVSTCSKNNVCLHFNSRKNIKIPGESENLKSSGFFDQESNPPTLAISTNKKVKDWLPILIHEYNHMIQWKKGLLDLDNIMWDWLEGKNYNKYDYTISIEKFLKCEIDCEKRTIKTIKKFNLPIDILTYIKKANSYLFFYGIIKEYRKWYQIPPYQNAKIINIMPNKFLSLNQYLNPSTEYTNMIFNQKIIKK